MKFLIDAVIYFSVLIRTKARVAKGGICLQWGEILLPEILLVQFYSRKTERRTCIYFKGVMGKAITFDQVELNFNLSCTSE